MKILSFMILCLFVTGCVVVPTTDTAEVKHCEISSDKKTLKIVDIAKDTNSYYSISGIILFPITGVVSGAYVAVNNIYHYGENKIVCG
ncbi:hypothetical protein tinsulaeT_08100 [Thalassotalea insulae]|uniref:Lipoprotein n=1 Tax=Thalassotalea insulae TaxID=2056778 RepID=A0ABQ6GSP6_9GAMM|nr:hypothetical protein [Thalassotalea insulae]GLX77470.1 hypothetical protein tinsulaeT_08100 [Thalassotalea insulae]